MWYMYVLLFYAVIKLIGEKNAAEVTLLKFVYTFLYYIYILNRVYSVICNTRKETSETPLSKHVYDDHDELSRFSPIRQSVCLYIR